MPFGGGHTSRHLLPPSKTDSVAQSPCPTVSLWGSLLPSVHMCALAWVAIGPAPSPPHAELAAKCPLNEGQHKSGQGLLWASHRSIPTDRDGGL